MYGLKEFYNLPRKEKEERRPRHSSRNDGDRSTDKKTNVKNEIGPEKSRRMRRMEPI